MLKKLNKNKINTILKSRKLENLRIINDIEKYLIKKRGYVIKVPPPGSNVILLFSGGLDTTIIASILMEEYKLNIYPIFTRRGHPYQKAEEKAADYFYKYFQSRYPGQFHKIKKVTTNFPPLEIRDAYEKVENKRMKPNSPQIWGDFFYSNLLCINAAQYSYYLKITKNIDIKTIFTAFMRSDGDGKIDMTLTTMRGIMLGLCLTTHDFKWQLISFPLEKNLGMFYNKEYFIKWAFKHNIPLEKTRSSCRSRLMYHCGKCLLCFIRRDAFRKARVVDRTIYINEYVDAYTRRSKKIVKKILPSPIFKMLKNLVYPKKIKI